MCEFIGFIDTAATIREDTQAEDVVYSAIGEEYAEAAEALLATVRRRLTGREEETCEAAVNGDSFDAFVLDLLINQYPREIAAWKDGVTV
jgi:hypothetical protein